MKFTEVAFAFLAINETNSRLKITETLSDLLKKTTSSEAQIISYLSLGSLRPPYQKMQFNLAEKSINKVIAKLLGMEVEELEKEIHKTGDVAVILQKSNLPILEDLTVTQVYERLVHIESISGAGSAEEKQNELYKLLKDVGSLNASYIAAIILDQLRLGFSDMTLIDSFSWMLVGSKKIRSQIEDAYNVCADIGLIAYTLKESNIEGIKHFEPKLGIPIRPAAAERLPSATAIIEKIGTCIAQPKLDGFRLQVHIDNKSKTQKIWFFSRNLLDMSEMFPDLKEALSHVDVDNIILEGEAIAYDEHSDRFVPFQETVKRKRKHEVEEVAAELPLKFFGFDLLYLNGKSTLNLTHEQRRNELIKIFKNYKDPRVAVVEEMKINTAKELENYFLKNIEAGLEGLVVKKPDSIYQPGKRNFNWIKLKKHEKSHLEDTIDAVVLGYYYGKGKRASFGIGAFLVGVYDKQNDRFQTVAKVGTGLKDNEWKELKEKCDHNKMDHKPKNVDCAPELEPDVWVDPKIVVVVRADEITQSPSHTAGRMDHNLGYALRFPRFVNYSPDKSPEQATTVHELIELYQLQRKS
ncbi:ATP-dependent DNA ligase [Candidatus Dependentiae bacterium]|nr:ATP-dependent DNA ligase [Candidatus Dependentiae bacterium]